MLAAGSRYERGDGETKICHCRRRRHGRGLTAIMKRVEPSVERASAPTAVRRNETLSAAERTRRERGRHNNLPWTESKKTFNDAAMQPRKVEKGMGTRGRPIDQRQKP